MPLGINVPQMAFFDLFLTWCLLSESAEITNKEYQQIKDNQSKTVFEGRRPGLMLAKGDESISLQQWGLDVLNEMKRSEEHTSELQSRPHLVCRLLLEKKKN